MGYGRRVDSVVGVLSRLLHLRGAKHNTVDDLGAYFDRESNDLFPPPEPIRAPSVKRTLLDRAIGSSTVSWRSSHEVLSDKYRERHEKQYRKNLTAWARWWRPDRKMRRGCLVYVHGWLEPGSWAEETTVFPKWSRELDVDLAHVSLPFHGLRKPRSALFSGEFFWTADMVRSMEGIRQAVCDTRAFVAWLHEQGYEKVGVTGISLGGAITMILACLDPTPDYIVPIIAHLHLVDIVEEAPIVWRMKHDLDKWGIDKAQRRALFDRLGLTRFTPVLSPDKQLWIQAREDVFIDASLVEKQWADWGRPEILWIDGGHMTFPLHIGEITRRIDDFQRQLWLR